MSRSTSTSRMPACGDEAALRDVLRDYGNAIKELAGANIFPGDCC